MNAWIDCMTYLNDPNVSDTILKAKPDEVVTLQLDYVDDLYKKRPDIYAALIECSAFVNWRQIQAGESPVLAISFNKGP
jgi:hypothetical protein